LRASVARGYPSGFGAGVLRRQELLLAARGMYDRRDRQQDHRDHAPDRQQPQRRGPRLGLHYEPTGAEGRAGGLGREEGVIGVRHGRLPLRASVSPIVGELDQVPAIAIEILEHRDVAVGLDG